MNDQPLTLSEMADDQPLTLPEVAAITGLSLRSIERGCRAGTIEHTTKGDGTIKRHRLMYPPQVRKLLAARQVGATKPVEVVPAVDDDLAAARAATRRMLARTGRRVA
ncbi:hypothetical protein ABZ671_00425 [Micromonospora sp. NPDC006766]|uniref:hypothetical protein n=1 Tax=Micromonospora sp. NPDC006766 TaxID=3154778 RepID=UPI0033F5F55D